MVINKNLKTKQSMKYNIEECNYEIKSITISNKK